MNGLAIREQADDYVLIRERIMMSSSVFFGKGRVATHLLTYFTAVLWLVVGGSSAQAQPPGLVRAVGPTDAVGPRNEPVDLGSYGRGLKLNRRRFGHESLAIGHVWFIPD